MPQKTQVIAGHEVTLTAGVRYIADRPIVDGKRTTFPVHIRRASTGNAVMAKMGLSYDQANAFINEFNNGTTSFDGRVW